MTVPADALPGLFSIGYSNALEYGTVTASTTATGFPVENLLDRLRLTRWKAAVNVDDEEQWVTLDLGDGNAAHVDYLVLVDPSPSIDTKDGPLVGWSDDGASWTYGPVLEAPFPRMASWYTERKMFGETSSSSDVGGHRFWRVGYPDGALSPGDQVRFSNILLGLRLDIPEGLPAGLDFDAVSPQDRANISRGGIFAGSITESVKQALIVKVGAAGVLAGWPVFGGRVWPGGALLDDAFGAPDVATFGRYVGSYFSRRRPIALRYDAPDIEHVWWARPAGDLKTPYIYQTRRGLELHFDVDVDNVLLKDVAP
jgi:hypothetical protein